MLNTSDAPLFATISTALDRLYERDIYLISHESNPDSKNHDNNHASERSIMMRLAVYIEDQMWNNSYFKEYSLDCEYNRNIDCIKMLPDFKNGVYPDFIIHQRGNNDHNLAVIEIKTYWNNDQSNDRKKIKEFIDPNGQYRYRYGILILITSSRNNVELEINCIG